MNSADLLIDAFGRVQEITTQVVGGLTPEQLTYRPAADVNSIAWLVWHLTRIQDDHVAAAAGSEQVWISAGWAERFELPFSPAATGYGHGPQEVAAVVVKSGGLLTGYHDAVCGRTTSYLRDLTDADLDRVVDESWHPPVTLGVRLVSIISDDLQHAGQAAYLRGIITRW
ncbi:MAG TPA: DinB family protein [Streptosporangiaceae bacterium]|nr:DinB family protein [Streptosporangiaceae bacterium]